VFLNRQTESGCDALPGEIIVRAANATGNDDRIVPGLFQVADPVRNDIDVVWEAQDNLGRRSAFEQFLTEPLLITVATLTKGQLVADRDNSGLYFVVCLHGFSFVDQ